MDRDMSERPGLPNPFDAAAYAIDAWQRSVLLFYVMRRRAVEYEEHRAEVAPNVLDYKAGLVLDGRRLERPVNYLLAHILPPEGVDHRPRKRPFVIVYLACGTRAGHRRLQGRQRDRGRDEGRTPCVFHRLPA